MGQLDLFRIEFVSYKGKTLAEAFADFDETNPHVYGNLRMLALEAVRGGRRRLGIKALFEALRWEYLINTDHAEGEYKLNNNLTAYYARKLNQDPELAGVFELRELKAGEKRRRIIETAASR
jgi:hypothetical protein